MEPSVCTVNVPKKHMLDPTIKAVTWKWIFENNYLDEIKELSDQIFLAAIASHLVCPHVTISYQALMLEWKDDDRTLTVIIKKDLATYNIGTSFGTSRIGAISDPVAQFPHFANHIFATVSLECV